MVEMHRAAGEIFHPYIEEIKEAIDALVTAKKLSDPENAWNTNYQEFTYHGRIRICRTERNKSWATINFNYLSIGSYERDRISIEFDPLIFGRPREELSLLKKYMYEEDRRFILRENKNYMALIFYLNDRYELKNFINEFYSYI